MAKCHETYNCPCGEGETPCPGKDGKPLCTVRDDMPDWDKPRGCTCETIAEARACYERCDDWLSTKPRTADKKWIAFGIIGAIIFLVAMGVLCDAIRH